MRTPMFLLIGLLAPLPAAPCLAGGDAGRKAYRCVGSWGDATPVVIEIADGKVFQNGEEMADAAITPDRIAYNKRDGADLFVTTITPADGKLTIRVYQSPRKEERAFLEGKCTAKP